MVQPKKKISLVLLAIVFVFVAISGLILNRKLSQPKDDEEAIRQEFARIRAPVKKRLESHNQRDEILKIEIENGWAILEFGGRYLDTGEPVPAGPGIIVFRKVMGIWVGATPGTSFWAFLIKSAPNTLVPPDFKELFRIL